MRPRPTTRWPRDPSLFGGSAEGNERLTAMTGVVLLVLLAVIGVTILRIRQLIWIHLFVGLVLLGPIAVKLGSTGYRFARYYTHHAVYRAKGAPPLILRAIAPGVVVSTVVVFVSGILLLAAGPAGKGRFLLLHKASFIVWLALTAGHVLGHLPQLPRSLLGRVPENHGPELGDGRSAGAFGRWIALTGAIVAGVMLAIALLGDFSLWTAHGAFQHHHHHD